MRSSHSLDRFDTAFDDDRLVADARLLLLSTLAAHLRSKALVEEHLDLGAAAGRAHPGDKLLKLVMSALAGGDFIDDADALRAGGRDTFVMIVNSYFGFTGINDGRSRWLVTA
jgi:hypothetical protein